MVILLICLESLEFLHFGDDDGHWCLCLKFVKLVKAVSLFSSLSLKPDIMGRTDLPSALWQHLVADLLDPLPSGITYLL